MEPVNCPDCGVAPDILNNQFGITVAKCPVCPLFVLRSGDPDEEGVILKWNQAVERRQRDRQEEAAR